MLAVDDAAKARVERDAQIAKDLGLIQVRLRFGTEYGRSNVPAVVQVKEKTLDLAEKSLKGKSISHGSR